MNVIPKASQTIIPQALRSFTSGATRTQSTLTPIFAEKGVHPIGPYYSQAIKANGFIFLSGQIPATSDATLLTGSVTEKTHKMIQNAGHVLEAAGSDLEKVVKVDLFMKDLSTMKEVNEVYMGYFPQRPARSACEVSKLPAGADMMMDLVAVE